MGCSLSTPTTHKEPIDNPFANIHKQLQSDVSPKEMAMEDVVIPDKLNLSADDFELGSYLQEGGMGKGEVTYMMLAWHKTGYDALHLLTT